MCGIVGILSNNNSVNLIPKVINGLKSLEYRGYDSAGIAFVENNNIKAIKSVGKIFNLERKCNKFKTNSSIIIGHTRWATHGKPLIKNTHPFLKKNCALVHNGIIENTQKLIKKYGINKRLLKSNTDSEVIAEIYNKLSSINNNPIKVLKEITKNIIGTYALVLITPDNRKIYAAKKSSPLIIGIDDNEISISSDILGLPRNCKKIIYMEDNDIAELNITNYRFFNNSKNHKKKLHKYITSSGNESKGKYKHYMLKEIYEQPLAIKDSLSNYTVMNNTIHFPKSEIIFKKISNIHLTACGTAYHACMIAKYWLEEITNIQTAVDISSEYRYRKCTLSKNSLGIVVSQSGETMDTLESLKKYISKEIKTVSIINVLGSSIARKSNFILPTIAGPEIGVASTKAFTTQLLILALFSLYINKRLKLHKNKYLKSLLELPDLLKITLKKENLIKKLIPILSKAKSIFYIGRGTMFPLALEGALKLKEVTYKHCEGYAAGELKHGPLALIEKNIPVIALAPYNEHFDKIISNIEEIKARDAKIIILTDKIGAKKINKKSNKIIILPKSNFLTAPIIYSIPVQLIAYHLANNLGTDIDQPRNLAKSVTVE